MKQIGLPVLLGILLAMLVIYLLHPLNVYAAGLVTVLCVAFAELVVKVISWFMKRGT
jgi:hypothetical protein